MCHLAGEGEIDVVGLCVCVCLWRQAPDYMWQECFEYIIGLASVSSPWQTERASIVMYVCINLLYVNEEERESFDA